ncbi:MAG TPA: porin [Catalimonadaceae bacterium]|nr:porin [Catalimonadaceae bacterium]
MNWIPSKFQPVAILFLIAVKSLAQPDSSWKAAPLFKVSGFVDAFYAFDFNKPESGIRQNFLYNHNRHNQFNLNFGYLKVGVEHQNYRANFALHSGTYVEDNYATEPNLLKNIFEANAGISLSRKADFWLDAGIFSSHIGFESAISIDNWTLTRSLLAENSPYYLAGAKLTFKPNQHWEMAALVCNGWQRIQPVKGNSMLSFGSQLKWIPNQNSTFNWSTFVGTNDPDSLRRIRFFNNFYSQFRISSRLGAIAGFDIGMQQKAKGSPIWRTWFSPVAIIRYQLSERWFTAVRIEYYQDQSHIIIESKSPNGFKTKGLSLNFDYLPLPSIACRIEGRWLSGQNRIFERNGNPVGDNIAVIGSIAIRIQ